MKKNLNACALFFLLSAFFMCSAPAQAALNLVYEKSGPDPDNQYGWRVLLADIDGDAVAETVVSARTASHNGIQTAGSVYIYNASGALIGSIHGTQADETFGEWVMARDLNQDEKTELVIGAPGYSFADTNPSHPSREGAIYIYSYLPPDAGHPAGQWILRNRLVGEFNRSCLGRIFSTSPDLDQDGIDELLIGAPCNPVEGVLNQGSVYIVSGKKAFEGLSLHNANIKRWDTDVEWDPVAQKFLPSETFYFGSCLDGLGDIDGDQVPDFIISAATATDHRLDPTLFDQRGVAIVFSGKKILDGASFKNAILFKVAGNVSKEWFGNVVMRVGGPYGDGDLDGDGVPDILVGAPGNDPGQAGAVYIYSGKKAAAEGEILNPVNSALIAKIDGEMMGDRFGYSIADVGYIDDDAVHDFAVGAPHYDAAGKNEIGKVYLYSGASQQPLGTFEGQLDGGKLGEFVAGTPRNWYIGSRPAFMAGGPYTNSNTGKAALLSSDATPPNPAPVDEVTGPFSPPTDPGAPGSSPPPTDPGTIPPPTDALSAPAESTAGAAGTSTPVDTGAAPSGGGGCSLNTHAQPKPGEIIATLILLGLPVWFSFLKRMMNQGGFAFMKPIKLVLVFILFCLFQLPDFATAAGNQSNRTLTVNTGMGVNNGSNRPMNTDGNEGTQCAGQSAGGCNGGPFAETTDPFNPNHDCSNDATSSAFCSSSFDPLLPGGFTVIDNRFGRGAPCGPNDTSGPPFPYPCQTRGSINQIVPMGIDDPNTPYITHNPPSLGAVGQPFYQFRSDTFGNLRVHHIEYGFDQFVEADNTQIMRIFFTIDSTTDSNGQMVGNAVGSFKMLIQDGSGAGCTVTTSNSSSEGRFESGPTGVITCVDRNGNLCPSPQFSPGRWGETSFRCLP